jgi:hypothetical protein
MKRGRVCDAPAIAVQGQEATRHRAATAVGISNARHARGHLQALAASSLEVHPPPLGEERDHRINARTGKRYSPIGQRLQRMGVQPGWPDFIFVGPNAQVFWLELKRFRTGRLAEDQSEVLAHLVACGFAVLVTSSLDDAVAILKQAGILRSNVELQ